MIWAFDTTGPWVAVAAHGGDRLLGVRRRDVRLRHNEMLQQITGDLRDDCGGQLPHTIALCVGPGSFTGTRVGTAFAAGLAEAVGAQVIPVSSFEVAASLAPPDSVRIGVAIPIVQEIWCLARLVRTHRGWQEESLDELPVDRIRAGGEEMPLVVPWGEAPGAILPGDEWQPAQAVLDAAILCPDHERIEPASVRIRYIGPSQAERNFRARQREH